MNDDRKKKREELFRLKQSIVDDLMGLSDKQLLKQAADDGVNADEARSRVLKLFSQAQQTLGARRLQEAKEKLSGAQSRKPMILSIDAAKAREILKRVASRTPANGPPLLMAARLQGKTSDDDVLDLVAALREKGVVSDDDLK